MEVKFSLFLTQSYYLTSVCLEDLQYSTCM